jgi:hypothetical protein
MTIEILDLPNEHGDLKIVMLVYQRVYKIHPNRGYRIHLDTIESLVIMVELRRPAVPEGRGVQAARDEKTGTTQIVKHRAMYTVYPHAVHKLFHLHEYMGLYEVQSGRFPLNFMGML